MTCLSELRFDPKRVFCGVRLFRQASFSASVFCGVYFRQPCETSREGGAEANAEYCCTVQASFVVVA